MFFKHYLMIRGLDINLEENAKIVYQFNCKGKILLEIRKPNSEDEKIGHNSRALFCDISGEFEPNKRVKDVFISLSENIVPVGSLDTSNEEWHGLLDEKGKIKEKYIIPIEILPKNFQDFCENVNNKLSNIAKSTILLTRWRKGLITGGASPFCTLRKDWSFDGLSWHICPSKYTVEIQEIKNKKININEITEIESMVNKLWEEPIYFTILNEAELSKSSNPKSAFILGMTAAEVGLKTLITDLLPETDWLMGNIPTPPIVKILEEYFPSLPARLKINNEVIVPKGMIKKIKDAVFARNKIIHQGENVNRDFMKEVLSVVKDLLWLIDYYRGYPWAIEYLSSSCKNELKIKTEF